MEHYQNLPCSLWLTKRISMAIHEGVATSKRGRGLKTAWKAASHSPTAHATPKAKIVWAEKHVENFMWVDIVVEISTRKSGTAGTTTTASV